MGLEIGMGVVLGIGNWEGDWDWGLGLGIGDWHIPIAKEHWTYLGVHFEKEDGTIMF